MDASDRGLGVRPRAPRLGIDAGLAGIVDGARRRARCSSRMVRSRSSAAVPARWRERVFALNARSLRRSAGAGAIPSVTPVLVASISLLGVLTLGAGWGAFHDRALDGASSRTSPPNGSSSRGRSRPTPRSRRSAGPPSPRCGGSSGRKGPRRSAPRSGSAGATRCLGLAEETVRLEGTLRVPDDEGFAEALRDKGIPAQLQLQTLRRLGPSSSAFIRATQAVRRIVGHSDRERVPRKEAGLLLGLLLGDDSQLDPGLERDFRASGLSHLLVVSGGNVAMVLAPSWRRPLPAAAPRWPKFAGVRRRGVLHDPDRCGAVGAPCGSDGLSRAGRDASRAGRAPPRRSSRPPCSACSSSTPGWFGPWASS